MDNSKAKPECNLKQKDILTAFAQWRDIKKEKDEKKAALCNTVIEISDSDTEDEEPVPNLTPKKKRPLAEPLFDEEDDKTDPSPARLLTPKKKRKLPVQFSDIEDESVEDSPNGSGEIMRPRACSTLLSQQLSDSLDTLNSPHMGIEDILNLSPIETDQTVLANASTVIAGAQIEKNILIRENIVIRPPGIEKRYSVIESDDGVALGMKRCAGEDRNVKIKKTKDRDGSQSSSPRWLSKKDRLIDYQARNGAENDTGGKKRNKSERNDKNEEKVVKSHDLNHNEVNKSVGKDAVAEKAIESDGDGFLNEKNSRCGKNKEKGAEKSHKAASGGFQSEKSAHNDKTEEKSPEKPDLNNKTLKKTTERAAATTKANENRPSTSKCTGAAQIIKSSPKKEKSMNTQPLKLITELFKKVYASRQIANIASADRETIRKFLDMTVSYQYICFKLLTWKRKWYNAHKFCVLIHADLEETDVAEMVSVFSEQGIVDTDYHSDTAAQLLPRLTIADVRGICDKFRLPKRLKTKNVMIEGLLKYATQQTTLTVRKTTKEVLMDEIHARMGKCVQLNERFREAFQSVYLLGTFTNPRLTDMREYIASVLRHNVVFPVFRIDDYVIFPSALDFQKFAKARQYRDSLGEISDPFVALQICRTIFDELRAIETDHGTDFFRDAPHLVRFTAKSVYVSALSTMAEKLFCKFPEDVKEWLEYLIGNVDCGHRIGQWYDCLVWLYMRHLNPTNCDRAAELLVEVLSNKRRDLSLVQEYKLRKRGEKLLSSRRQRVLQVHQDRITELLPKRVRDEEFPQIVVDANTVRSNALGLKRNYLVRDQSGNKAYLQVEEIALNHYVSRLGYTDGRHCEGAFVKATFTLFFYDVIYNETKTIPGAFVSDLQSEPLDLNTRYFYTNRQQEIDRRLRDIESDWPDEHLLKFLRDKYDQHSHEFGVCEVGNIIPNAELLDVIVECVGRSVLAKIYKRLVQNFREYRSGLPDLLVWNTDTKKCKFVEVKGENDRLSVAQALWLDYLRKIGASIEVCHVHSIGSKKKVKKVEAKEKKPTASTSRDDKPSTSSCSA